MMKPGKECLSFSFAVPSMKLQTTASSIDTVRHPDTHGTLLLPSENVTGYAALHIPSVSSTHASMRFCGNAAKAI